ncbi:exopolyphosphatase [soil metagenome]
MDLGSNSFHMVVARFAYGQLAIIDRLREMVRLGGGLDEQRRIEPETAERAIACLERFGERLRAMHADNVRAVGTNTLRRARGDGHFLARAERALGHPIEIISGIEEARLVYLGAAGTGAAEVGRRLVVDIGGGSTELVIGSGLQPERLDSLYIGCVGISAECFPHGRWTAAGFERARIAASLELEPIAESFRKLGWSHAAGTSGTVRATADILRGMGYADGVITPGRLTEIAERLIGAGRAEQATLPGLTDERAPVYAGGLAILQEIFASLDVGTLRASDGALREGLLYDLLGRMTDEDARERSVMAFAERYHVDREQAARVAQTAGRLLERVAGAWALHRPIHRMILRWSAWLHELGLDISHARHHRHAAYLLEHADLPGFPRLEQQLIAGLVGAHRRKVQPAPFAGLPEPWQQKARYLLVILRLAVLLHRGRRSEPLPSIEANPSASALHLRFPPGWIEKHPLTRLDLDREVRYLDVIDFRLTADFR